jgi:DNA-binding NarL/FixJ family response regulator
MGFAGWLVQEAPEISVEGVGTVEAAYEHLNAAKFDLVLTELCFPGRDGFAMLTKLLAEMPLLRVLVVTHLPEVVYAHRAIDFGARGYVMKSECPEAFLIAIRAVISGKIHVSEDVSRNLLQTLYPDRGLDGTCLNSFSTRELQVFYLLGTEPSQAVIASKLGLGLKTVETHIFNIRTKMGKVSLNQLRALAQEWVAQGRFQTPECGSLGAVSDGDQTA